MERGRERKPKQGLKKHLIRANCCSLSLAVVFSPHICFVTSIFGGPLQNSGCPFSPTAESFGVSAQIGSGVVQGRSEVRFHEGSTRVPRGFARAAGWCEL